MIKGIIKEFIKEKLAIIVVALIAVVAIVGVFAYNPFNWNLNFGFSKLKIDKTENVISEIRNISELTSARYYEEFVIKEAKSVQSKWGSLKSWMRIGNDSTKNELVMIAKGNVRAGFNLKHLEESDVRVDSDTLYINLPKAEIFDVIINPSDFETYVEEGKWSHDEFVTIQSRAKDLIKQNAIEYGILETAERHGKEKLTALFKGFGFSGVVIQDKE